MQSQPSPIPALADLLRSQPAPVILLDTCALLDIPRSLYRIAGSQSPINQTLNALEASATAAPELYLVVSEQVVQEYTKNLPSVLQELGGQISNISAIGHALLPAGDSSFLTHGLAALESNLIALTSQIFNSSLTIANDQSCLSQAAARLANGEAPGKMGSSNVGDCLVIEHFLELVRQLRSRGNQQLCIFVSSNYKDFGRASNPKAPLDAEFSGISLDYMPDIGAAMLQLGF